VHLEDVYDEPTLRAIDRPARPTGRTVGGWRGAVVAGVLHTAMAGVRDAIEPEAPKPEVVEVRRDPRPRSGGRVSVFLVPDSPRLTRAIVWA
jgi:hypothetical protein